VVKIKHNPKIIIILLVMFILTQFIGLYVVNHYSSVKVIDGQVQNVTAPELPFGMESPEIEKESDYNWFFMFIVIAFIIAITLMFLFSKLNLELVLKIWFFVVIVIALGVSFNSIIPKFAYASLLAFVLSLPLAYFKIFKRDFLVHNLTELLVYPGIAAIFVPILNIYTIIALLILISVYDMWAVWHSGIMQKMARYQIDKLNVFSGFFVPYVSKNMRKKIKSMKKILDKEKLNKKKIRVNIAILGGGDVIFTIIAAGVALKTFGFTTLGSFLVPIHSLFIIVGATLGLALLFIFSEKKKFYPAMPFITAGIFLGMILGWLVF